MMVPHRDAPPFPTDLIDPRDMSVAGLGVLRAHDGSLAGRDDRFGSLALDGGIGTRRIVGAIARDASDGALRFIEHRPQLGGIAGTAVGELGRGDQTLLVDAQMELSPSRMKALWTVFRHRPLSLAEDLESGRIDHHVKRLALRTLGDRPRRERLRTPRQRGVIGDRKIDTADTKKRAEQTLGLPPRELEEKTKSQAELDDDVGVAGLASGLSGRRRSPSAKDSGGEPDGDVSSKDQAAVVLRPVVGRVPSFVVRMNSRLAGSHRPILPHWARPLGPRLEQPHQCTNANNSSSLCPRNRAPAPFRSDVIATLYKQERARYPYLMVTATGA